MIEIVAQELYNGYDSCSEGTGKTGGATIGPDYGTGLPIDLYNSAVDSKYDKQTQEDLMYLTIAWYNADSKEKEDKIIKKLNNYRDYLDSKTGKVLTGISKVTDGIDEFINEATMAIMASGIQFSAELSLNERIVAESAELDILSTRLKLNYQLFAEKSEINFSSWTKGSFESIERSVTKHFMKHGAEVGAADVEQYIRKSEEFAKNLKGARKASISGDTPNVTRYYKNGRYIDMTTDGKIISFGKQ